MRSNVINIVLLVLAAASMMLAVMHIAQIGEINEDKSRYSYITKTGDSNPDSKQLQDHIAGSKLYGNFVGMKVAIFSTTFGILLCVAAYRIKGNGNKKNT